MGWEVHIDYDFFYLNNKVRVIDTLVEVIKMKDKRLEEVEGLKCSKDLTKVAYQFEVKKLNEKIELLEKELKGRK
jgi:hypothetical protein